MELNPERALEIAEKLRVRTSPPGIAIRIFPDDEGVAYGSRVDVTLGGVLAPDPQLVIEQLQAVVALAEEEGLTAEAVGELRIVLRDESQES